jgi:predicted ATP-dependent serine protease
MGGVGKTQIAIEYVSQFETQYEGVYWITTESSAQLLSGFASIANETRCTETKSCQQTEVAEKVLNWLYRNTNWLLVLDNLDDISIASGYVYTSSR